MPTTVTGKIENLGQANVSIGTFVRFYLRGAGGNQPRVNGTALIAPTLGNVYYFDFVPNASGVISGTLWSTRDATGLLGGDIETGGVTTAVWYGMVVFSNGKAGPETPIHAKNTATFDISNVTPITTNPVVTAPTGDSTYARLDSGNQPFTGNITAQSFGKVQMVNAGTAGVDWCAKVQTADTALGATHGEIWIDASAVINACATVPTITAGHTLRFLQGGTYVLSNTLTLSGSGSKLVGVGAGMGETGSILPSGVTLQAISGTFPSATPVVKFHDITKGGLQWVNVDCNNVTNCTAIQYDSDNAPPSSQNTFENFTLTGFHHGFVMGVDGTTVLQSPASCAATPNQLGCYQMDTDRIENFQLYGNPSDTTAIGFLINSANGFQQGRITRGNIQNVNQGVRIVIYNGGGQLDNFNFGSPLGSSPTAIKLDTNAGAPTTIFGMETEGTGWTFGIHDSSCNPLQTTPVSTWTDNQLFGSGGASTGALVDGCAFIISQGNTGQTTTYTAAGTSRVLSLGDQRVWTTSGSGVLDYWYSGDLVTSGKAFIGGKAKVGTSLVLGSAANDSGIIGLWLNSNAIFTAPGTTVIAIDNAFTLPTQATSKFDGYFSSFTGAASTVHALINDFEIGGATAGAGGSITTQNMITCGAPGGAGTTNCLNNSGAANIKLGTGNVSTTNLLIGGAAPTISTHFNTSGDSILSNGTASFVITVGTGTGTSTGAIALPTAANGWNCWLTNQTRAAQIQQTGSTSASATFTNFSTTFSATNWTNSDVLRGGCMAN